MSLRRGGQGTCPYQEERPECEFRKLRAGWEVGAFRYQPHHGKRPHRFVVVRRPIPQDPVEAGQLTLFQDNNYAYHVLVTNLRSPPWRVWRFYAPHATIEKDVRQLLYDDPLGKIPTDDGVAHVAFFQILLSPTTGYMGSKGCACPRTICTQPGIPSAQISPSCPAN